VYSKIGCAEGLILWSKAGQAVVAAMPRNLHHSFFAIYFEFKSLSKEKVLMTSDDLYNTLVEYC
jgi:hypothetical protein